MPNNGRSEDLIGIQYLRGIAALLVVLDHAEGMAALPKYLGTYAWGGILTRGAIGVDLFFVISGFIIAYVSLSAGTLAPRVPLSTFALKRAVRILPFMWLAIVAYAALRYVARGVYDPFPYLRAIVLWPVGDVDPNVVWTLRHEMLFYAVFALSMLSGQRWLRWALPAYFLSPLAYAVLDRVDAISDGHRPWYEFFFAPLNLLFGLGWMVGIAYLILPGFRRLKHFQPRASYLLILLTGPALLLFAHAADYSRDSIAQVAAAGLLCATILACALMVAEARTWPLRLAAVFGNASYAIYLTHEAVVSATLGGISGIASTLPWIDVRLAVAAAVIIAVVAGIGVHFIVEKPLLRWAGRVVTAINKRKSVPEVEVQPGAKLPDA